MKKMLCVLLLLPLLRLPAGAVQVLSDSDIAVAAPSAILIEASTGETIYEKNALEHRSIASVTKIMTMLIAAEEIDSGRLSLDDTVTASARAASMGGSQIWLEEGEQMSVGEMLKCIAVVSANDCCTALAEHIAGTEDAFVARMNEKAAQLGMNDTHFTCCSGLLESDLHYSCARDIAVMSRELLKHDFIRSYTTLWMDTIRNGEFTLANTNKLIYYYPGATGLKTGFTTRAMYCLSASAERDGTEYIAVVLGAQTSAERFDSAKALLNFAFANYSVLDPAGAVPLPAVTVELGETGSVSPALPPDSGILAAKKEQDGISYEVKLPPSVKAPVYEGQMLGSLVVTGGGKTIAELPLVASCGVPRLSVGGIFMALLRSAVGVGG